MRRWLTRILVLLVLLLIAATVTVHVILRTDIPKRIVLRELESQSGLRVTADAIETGWFGETSIRGLSVSLPLESKPFLTVPELDVSHAALLPLLLTGDVAIAAVEARRPVLHLQPDARGAWNLIEAAERIAARQAPGADRAPPALPSLGIRDARVTVQAPGGRVVRYEPITVTGAPDGVTAWRGDANFPPNVDINAELSVGGAWSHRVDFDLQGIRSMIEPWWPEAPERLCLAGTWRGEVRDGRVSARLTLDPLEAERATARGETDIVMRDNKVTLVPIDLIVTLEETSIESLRIAGGRVESDGVVTSAQQLVIEAMDTRAQLDGRWSRADGSAELRARWDGRSSEPLIAHQGHLEARGDLPIVGQKSLVMQLAGEGHGSYGAWRSILHSEISGPSWTSLSGAVEAPELQWTRGDASVDLRGLTVALALDWPMLTISRVAVPPTTLEGEGRVAFDTREWIAALSAEAWSPHALVQSPRLPADLAPISFELRAHGEADRLTLESLRAQLEDVLVEANATYEHDRDAPLNLELVVNAPLARLDAPDLEGQSRTTATVNGSILSEPIDLEMRGRTMLEDVAWRNRPVDAIEIPWRGEYRDDSLVVGTGEFALMSGRWTARVNHAFENDALAVMIEARAAGLEPLAKLFDVPIELSGRADMEGKMALRALDLSTMKADGAWEVRGVTGPTIADATGRGRFNVRDGIVRLQEMVIEEDDRRVEGEARFRLDEPALMDVSLAAHRWPVSLRDLPLDLIVDGRIDGRADLSDRRMRGEFDGAADVFYDGYALGTAELEGMLDDRVAELRAVRAELFGGTLAGDGRVVLDPDRWMESALSATWSGIDLAEVDAMLDLPEPLTGHISGRWSIGPANDPRAPEPMRFDVAAQLDDASLGPITLGQANGLAAADEHGDATVDDLVVRGFLGRDRVMIERADWALAGGKVGAWGRLSRHDGEPFAHVYADLDALDLQQFALFAGQTARPMPGRIGGWITAGGYVRAPHRLFGQSRLSLRDSDLAALPFISLLYDTLRLSFGETQPTGEGEAVIRLEGNALEVSRFIYFNRGTDVIARMTVQDLTRGRESPIDGVAAGGIRPLRDVELPFFDQLDRLVGAVQSNAASVRIEGTLGEPESRVVPLAEVFGAIGRILRGGG